MGRFKCRVTLLGYHAFTSSLVCRASKTSSRLAKSLCWFVGWCCWGLPSGGGGGGEGGGGGGGGGG